MAYQLHHNTKRKFDDYAAADAWMRYDETIPLSLSSPIQFFVRMFSGGKTLVLQADSSDSVASVHRKIQSITGIRSIQSTSGVPRMEQRLIYRGKQLQLQQRLSECGIQNDDTLQLVGRMRSTRHPHTWRLMNDLNSLIHDLCNCNDKTDVNANVTCMMKMLTNFLRMTPKDGADRSEQYLQIFIDSSVPAALVKLYVSPSVTTKQATHECICQFIDSCKTLFANPVTVYRQFAPILFEFCKILRGAVGVDDALYMFCRSSLAAMMEGYVHDVKCMLRLQDVFPFVRELATRLSCALELSVQSAEFIQLSDSDVREFIKFMHPVKCAIRRQQSFGSPVSFPSLMQSQAGNERIEIEGVHRVFCDLQEKMELCLKKLESQLGLINKERGEPIVSCWPLYLLILKELESISKLYKGLEEMFWEKMRQRRVELCFLIVRLSKKSTDYEWILEHKEVTNFKIRQHFALKMLREGRHKNEEFYEMLICRSRLFEESFEYIGHASSRSLRGQLFMQFENEEATGHGVLREWFSLVCEAIFNPHKTLFVLCPNDGKRFFPYPAGEDISFEDIRDADPYLYSGCKKILEMDTKMVDEDILGLTFVCEDEELGSRKAVELCPNGKNMTVNSENMDNYINLLVKHCFVTSIAHQVAHFARGFAD